VPKGKGCDTGTQDELDKAYCISVKAQERGKTKFLAPGEIINEYISRGIWGQVGAKIVIFLSYCPFGFSLDEETNNISINFLFAFFGTLGIKIITIDRCLENSAPGSKAQNRGKSGGWEWVWGWGEDGEDGQVQEIDKLRQEMITDITAGKIVLTPGGAAPDIARIWGVASHYDDLYHPMCATSSTCTLRWQSSCSRCSVCRRWSTIRSSMLRCRQHKKSAWMATIPI
jgi:hypothetical protein